MSSKPKIMLMGYGRHGKDTVADILKEKYGYKHASSSWTAAEIIFPLLKLQYGYAEVIDAFNDRHGEGYSLFKNNHSYDLEHNMREVWHEAIKLINYGDKTTLARTIFKDNDIYVGIRSHEEFKAIKHAGLFDYAIWVDASKRCPPEEAGSCTVSKDLSNIVLNNNGTLEELEEEVYKLVLAIETVHYNDKTFWEYVSWN